MKPQFLNPYGKRFLYFIPLVLGFVLVFIAMGDLKHPVTRVDHCQVLELGTNAAPYKHSRNLLYSHGKEETHDIALACNRRGIVVLNDYQPFDASIVMTSNTDISRGTSVTLTQKMYQYLPDIWRISVEQKVQ